MLGGLLVALGLPLGALLAPFWSPKGLLGLILSPFWRPFGSILVPWGILGRMLAPFRLLFVSLLVVLGFQELLWASFYHLAGPRVHFWCGFEAVGANLVHKT